MRTRPPTRAASAPRQEDRERRTSYGPRMFKEDQLLRRHRQLAELLPAQRTTEGQSPDVAGLEVSASSRASRSGGAGCTPCLTGCVVQCSNIVHAPTATTRPRPGVRDADALRLQLRSQSWTTWRISIASATTSGSTPSRPAPPSPSDGFRAARLGRARGREARVRGDREGTELGRALGNGASRPQAARPPPGAGRQGPGGTGLEPRSLKVLRYQPTRPADGRRPHRGLIINPASSRRTSPAPPRSRSW